LVANISPTARPVNFDSIESLLPDLELGENRRDFLKIGRVSAAFPRVFKSHQPFVPPGDPRSCGFAERPSKNFDCSKPVAEGGVGSGMEEYQCLCPVRSGSPLPLPNAPAPPSLTAPVVELSGPVAQSCPSGSGRARCVL
jgi:hypothetical protein